ncbi:uncharacterized protein LOC108625026 isoform X2 [Ceratina calcarata]|uniref:Uncharacterized protein LOC108625026 isoform X2 n=1 Tax=Ceratina calcarata TaxID=156304 RepID=A0AAJ7S2D1_9HYME|nr:uncharacterized protein LOC108625026 isoform X2 [Ceratina calcarata]
MAVTGLIVYLLVIINAHTRSQYTDDSDYKDLELYEEMPFENEDSLAKRSPVTKLDWYKPERVYRYTKHRIPGYDYDELDYVVSRNFQQCDEKSVWTHCLCQFTCTEPDVVDCYSPCKSGCECKEEYVYDEKTQQCLLPDQCSLKEEDFYIK